MNLLGDGTWKVRRSLPVESEFQFRYLASSGGGINDEAADASSVLNDHGTEIFVVRTMRLESL